MTTSDRPPNDALDSDDVTETGASGRGATEDRAPTFEDRAPTSEDRAPTSDDRQPTTEHRRPISDDRRPISDDRQPRTDFRQPISDDREPISDDRAQTTEHRRPTSDDREPISDDRWSAAENGPGGGGPRSIGRVRVRIGNRSDGGILYWTAKLYAFAAIVLVLGILMGGVCTYDYFVDELNEDLDKSTQGRKLCDLSNYSGVVAGVSRVHSADGTLLAEFAEEWRELAPYEEIPEDLVKAFLAAEDHEFFDHGGLYFKGIFRAAWRNITAGDFEQGGSTITQQVAKQCLSSEKSLTRKAKEAILARRLESTYSKKAILSAYMNQIFLGNGAYGVRAAALRYFGRRLEELTLGQMATIAGLAQAPSRYSPTRSSELAIERRNEILDRMVKHGFVDSERAEAAKKSPLDLMPYEPVFGKLSPFYAQHLREYVKEKYGEETLMTGGLRIESAVEPVTDAIAYENVDFGARKQDKRQGFRGPLAYLDEGTPREVFRDRAKALYGVGPLVPGKRYVALVEKISAREATVLVGETVYELPLENMSWAAPWNSREAVNDVTITSVTQALRVGDVVWVSREQPLAEKFYDWHLADGVNPRWTPPLSDEQLERRRAKNETQVVLEQVPHPQSAIITVDHETGYVVAQVGGTDFNRNVFDRTTQALRQPGSTWKPIYYSAAIDMGYGFDTALNDKPHAEIDPVTGEIWQPENLGGTVDHKVNMEYSLTFSKNLPSVNIFKLVGTERYSEWVDKLGFSTQLVPDDCLTKSCTALALGAVSVYLHDLTRAFAIFARNGRYLDMVWAKRIFDRSGNLIEDNSVYYDPSLTGGDRLNRLAQTAGLRPKQAISARTAFLTNKLLRNVITHGFSTVVRNTGVNAAGKTGTSSATMDTSFVAFTSRWITSVWLGDDQRQRPLGVKDAAYMTVVPMWARYMVRATAGHPNLDIPWSVPEGVKKNDRGDQLGEQYDMPLIYRKQAKPEDLEGAGMAPADT